MTFAPLFAIALASAAAPAELAGVWDGTIGTLPVRACFVHREWGDFGAYYYRSRLQMIALDAQEGIGNAFREGNGGAANAPQWLVETANASNLTGRWRGNGRTLPIRLSRVAGVVGDETPCSSQVFHQPRLAGIRVVRTRGSVDGVGYTRMRLDHGGRFDASFETFALDGDSEPVRRVNGILSRGLAGSPPEWFECIRESLAQSASEGSMDERFAPAMIARRWMSVAHHWDGFCGGAHPSSSNSYLAFDLTTGRQIDIFDWLNARAVRRERVEGAEEQLTTLLPALRDAILARWRPEGEDCGEVVRGADYWNVGLTRNGLVFAPSLPHVVQACEEEFTLPFGRLAPFLTPAGAENVRALQRER